MIGERLGQARTIASLVGMNTALAGGWATGQVLRNPELGRKLGCSVAFDLQLALSGIRLKVSGEEHLKAPRPAIFAFNHQSNLDPLIVFKLVKTDFTATGKAEAKKDPAAGMIAIAIDAVLIDRHDPEKARGQMAQAAERLRGGESILIAPEGTRSLGAEPGVYRTGFVHLAIDTGAPIVPVVLKETGPRMPKRTINPGTVEVVVQPPVFTDTWKRETAREHAEAVRVQMAEELLRP